MSTFSNAHDQQEHLDRTYRKYAPQYDAAFSADPNPQSRKFDAMASIDDIQWKRLEVYRGNDKEAYQAHLSNSADPLAKPTVKEAAAWKANQADQWRIDREPAFGQHEATNNKWLGLTPEQRNSEKGQAFLAHVDNKHGAGYEAYAAKAGNHAVDRSDYLRTMAVVEAEGMSALAQQQKQVQAPAQQPATTTNSQVSPAAFQEQAPQAPASQKIPAQEPRKSRLSLAEFQGTAGEYIAQREAVIVKQSDSELEQTKTNAVQQHEAQGLGKLEEQHEKVESYNRVQASLAAARAARRQESLAEAQNRNRSRSQ